jgi:transaldolase
VEVTTDDPAEMLIQGRGLAKLAVNIVVKIPIINACGVPCLHVIKALTSAGVKVNCTAILSFNQMVLAAKAGATYLSIFAGRVADEGQDPAPVIRDCARWVERWALGKILVGSIRGVIDVQVAAVAGAHIITVPPQFLAKMTDHKYSRDTVRGFNEDAEKALGQIRGLDARGKRRARDAA